MGELRRAVVGMATQVGLGETKVGQAAIVATELATNLLRHATMHGEMLARPLEGATIVGVELLSLDRGPGMEDPEAMLEDGISTAGGHGSGLGAVQRLSDEFAIYSRPRIGTVILARLWSVTGAHCPNAPHSALNIQVDSILLPKPGQKECGDQWHAELKVGGGAIAIADGLGHGGGAAGASQKAMQTFASDPLAPPTEILERTHEALRGTRGVAIAVANFSMSRRQMEYAGVGNISAFLVSASSRKGCVSADGIVGYRINRLTSYRYPLVEGAMLIMHTDGLRDRWSLTAYPNLIRQHPAVVAAVLYRDFALGTDDVTVLVARIAQRRQ